MLAAVAVAAREVKPFLLAVMAAVVEAMVHQELMELLTQVALVVVQEVRAMAVQAALV